MQETVKPRTLAFTADAFAFDLLLQQDEPTWMPDAFLALPETIQAVIFCAHMADHEGARMICLERACSELVESELPAARAFLERVRAHVDVAEGSNGDNMRAIVAARRAAQREVWRAPLTEVDGCVAKQLHPEIEVTAAPD